MSHVNRDQETPGAAAQEQNMEAELAQVLDRMGTKNETLEQAVEAVTGRLDANLVAYAQGKTLKPMTLKQVREIFPADTHSVKNGVFTVRRGFFYSNGFSADAYAAKVLAAFPTATIVDCGEVWKAFRGGASVAQGSHWFVKFTFKVQQ